MKGFLYFIIGIFCDNIELSSKEFDRLIIGTNTINSCDLKKFNSVKISFQGTSIFKIRETQPRVLELYDSTVYFNRPDIPNVRIDFEEKVYGLTDFVWRFLISLIFIAFVSTYTIHRMLKKTFIRKLFNNSIKF